MLLTNALQVIERQLRESESHVKWVPNPAMIAGVPTREVGVPRQCRAAQSTARHRQMDRG